jgi:DNA invertase Pin-like site-specific DNA recombinase
VTALEEFQALGVNFISHQEAIDTSTPAGEMLFHVIGAMAEFEREIIRERVCAGIRAVKKKGVKLGRPRVELDLEKARELRKEGLSLRTIAAQLGSSKDTLRTALRGM